jgi:hypothetical protein
MRSTTSRIRQLNRIEKMLLADEPSLDSLFAVFTRLTRDEAMPATERVTAGRWRLLNPTVAIPLALVTIAGTVVSVVAVLMLISSAPGRQMCNLAVAPSASRYPSSEAASCQPGPAAGGGGATSVEPP